MRGQLVVIIILKFIGAMLYHRNSVH